MLHEMGLYDDVIYSGFVVMSTAVWLVFTELLWKISQHFHVTMSMLSLLFADSAHIQSKVNLFA
jgi:hypothetical protein